MPKQKRILTEEEKQKIADAKKELNEYRENIKYIEGKLAEVEDIKGTTEKVTSILSRVKISNTNERKDKFGDAISELEEIQEDCAKEMKEILLKRIMLIEKIEKIAQPYKNVLFYRYIRVGEWNDVANELGYAKSYVWELHGEALYLYSQI